MSLKTLLMAHCHMVLKFFKITFTCYYFDGSPNIVLVMQWPSNMYEQNVVNYCLYLCLGPLVEAESGVGHEEHPHSSFLIGIWANYSL